MNHRLAQLRIGALSAITLLSSVTDVSADTWQSDVWRVLRLQDYNTRVVLLGTLILGIACGVVGTFTLLRRRALIGDAASHATLPGLAIAFMIMAARGGDGKFLPGLLLGATIAGLLGMGTILLIRHTTRLKEDAALGIVLSVYFGFGMALLGVIQKMRTGHAAGLEAFIYGKTASMLAADAWLIAGMAVIVMVACALLFKELALLCFDQEYAAARGYPVRLLDIALMMLITLAVVTGLQAVGLILVIALLIIPPAAARFWTNHLGYMCLIAALIGGISGVIGAGISAMAARLPAGAIIVVVAGVFFFISMIIGPARGMLYRGLHAYSLRRKTGEQHLLRVLHEWQEVTHDTAMPFDEAVKARSWSSAYLRQLIRAADRRGWVRPFTGTWIELTEAGHREAKRVVRNHRLWETYLIHYAQIAPHHVDHNADRIEHVLGAEMVEELERLAGESADRKPMSSPHPLLMPQPGGQGNT